MNKSIFIFLAATILSIGMIAYGWGFVDGQIGEDRLAEETLAGDRSAAEGLAVSFRADSGDDLHWMTSYDYSAAKTDSSFRRGEMEKKTDTVVYDDMRFTGWSAVPFYTQLEYDGLGGLQDKKIQTFYDKLQKQAEASGKEETGVIKLGDYLDYYPISFRFQFGEKVYNSSSMLSGLKTLDEEESLTAENTAPYAGDMELYVTLNDWFRIPVIDNEYQKYSVSKVKDDKDNKSVTSKTEVRKPLGEDQDYYEFDPVIVLQQEDIKDGMNWEHPDIAEGQPLEEENDDTEDEAVYRGGSKASDYGLKNRLLFVPNNRTVKGKLIDVSQMKAGFGIYELPIDADATIAIGKGRKNLFIPDPKPLTDQLDIVYPLDAAAECVEISLSGDHRYLAVFSIKGGSYYVEIIDADTWESKCTAKMFPASETMAYAWGDDGTLAVTDHKDHIAILTRTEDKKNPYREFYTGEVPEGFTEEMFTSEMIVKKHSYARYKYGSDNGLAVTTQNDKVALAQNSLAGDPEHEFRNPDLECAVIDRTGVSYHGILKSSLVDVDYDMTAKDLKVIEELSDGSIVKGIIKPVGNENRAEWSRESRTSLRPVDTN